MLCSIIIRTYNEARYIGDLLRMIGRQAVIPAGQIEVIVIDSGSTDATVATARQAGARVLTIAKSEFTFGRSLNLGCAAAHGEFLVIVSGHCVPVDDHWLERLLAPFADPAMAMVYGRQRGGPATKFSEHRLLGKYFPAGPQPSQGAAFCNNANAAVRSGIWRRFRYDETLTGLEDLMMGRCVVREGFRIAYVAEAAVFHYHHEGWLQIRRRYEREAVALRRIQPEIQVGWLDAWRYFIAAVVVDMMAAIREGKLLAWPEIAAFRLCQYYGTWEGSRPHRVFSERERERYFFPT